MGSGSNRTALASGWRPPLVLALCLFGVSCFLDPMGLGLTAPDGDGDGDTDADAEGDSDPVDADNRDADRLDADPEPRDAGFDADSDGGADDADVEQDADIIEECVAEACPGWRCVDNLCSHYASCLELRDSGLGLSDGVYPLDRDALGPEPEYAAYCDMATDGGGWTLVARTATGPSAASAFGWESSTGSVHDETQPYSLGVTTRRLVFSQILLGNHSGGNAWGSHVYRIDDLPGDIMSAYREDNYPEELWSHLSVDTVVGDCHGPDMFHYMGYTGSADIFFFRDYRDHYDTGLKPNRWDTHHDNCWQGGDLNDDPGMIMVR